MNRPSLAKRIGRAMRSRREARRVSQEAFADAIQMHRTYYGAIERGEKNLQVTTLERVCDGLGARVWEVIKEAETAEK